MESICNSIMLLFFLFILHLTHLPFGLTKHTAYSNASCFYGEWKALVEFKGSLVDKSNRLSSWKGRDCCSWEGITCSTLTGHVQKLDLSNPKLNLYSPYDFFDDLRLEGEISPSLLHLEHLEYFNLSFNNFLGIPIPPFLGSLKNLQYLDLFKAGFSGEIPQNLGNLSNLHHVRLGDSFPFTWLSAKSLEWITGLSSIKTLDLSGTNLSESVDWLYSVNRLPSLSSLALSGCELVGAFSPSLSHVNLTSLVSLDLSFNNFNSTFPLWLFNLSSLENLRLSGNNLRGPFPSMFENFPTLFRLDLFSNSFNSSFPDSLCNLTGLIYMDLSVSQLQGSLPLCLGNMTSLSTLHLGFNELGGEIPNDLSHLKQLTDLDLSKNYFSYSIPSSFGELLQLERLSLYENQLYGTIPLALGKLSKLQALDISYNSLTGELSESFFEKLKSLKYLSISKNQGVVLNVSSQWIPPFQIHTIEMDSVFIGTQFPPWLRTQRNVSMLIMRNTSIFGAIPGWFRTSYPTLYWSDLSNNLLTGPIPTFYINYKSPPILGQLNLANNQLTGNIPEDFCKIWSLAVLSLANNQLTGRIPLCLGNLRQLGALDLANNSLSGHIPNTLGNLNNLIYLHLNGNKFVGRLPSSLQNLTRLTTLDLSENQLRDAIPEWIGKEFSRLQYLRLQSNKFYGGISVNLCQLKSLQILNVAQNNLVGNIPPCLGNLSQMLLDGPGEYYTNFGGYGEAVLNINKGTELEYSSNLKYAKFISLSGNRIHGEIPNELMDLIGLNSLNLSNNDLRGEIPEKIGNLKRLESLDLSMNQFSGPIPQSLANIDALSYLNLSFNDLAGPIPSGNHFDTFNNQSIFEGNSGLCGKPLAKRCHDGAPSKENGDGFIQRVDDGKFELLWFLAGVTPGFAVGLSGVFCILHFKKSWRLAYFRFLDKYIL